MPKITFRLPHEERVVHGRGRREYYARRRPSRDPRIVGECGGDMSCATCHVYCEDQSGFKRASADEEDLLELHDDRRGTSRLGCQLKLTTATTDVVVEVPQ